MASVNAAEAIFPKCAIRRNQAMEKYILWLDDKNKIVSFHEEDGYEKIEFSIRDFFINYLLSAGNTGYRFQ